ncbi:HAD family hydrolase [Mycoplasmopsis adleri]|uniref:HAD family hydrolase n=1 Tax=Mycoplasmopsis adleri TaxID=51362 RepID=UPI003873A7C3
MIKRIVFSDIDGTIYGFPEKQLMPETKEDVLNAIELDGVQLVLTTGNPLLPKLIKLANELQSNYLICAGGALIYDIASHKILDFHSIPSDVVKKTAEIVNNKNVATFMYGKDNYYLLNGNEKVHNFFDEFFEYSDWVTDNDNYLTEPIGKIEIYANNPKVQNKIYKELQAKLDNCNLLYLSTHLEITPIGISKGSGLLKVCEILDADPKYVMSIGDGENDCAMFEVSGFSYAMDNANNTVKQASKYYTSDVLQNGFGEAIKDYIHRTKIDLIKQENEIKREKWLAKERRNEFYKKLAENNQNKE